METLTLACIPTPAEKRERAPRRKYLNTIRSRLAFLLILALSAGMLFHAFTYYERIEEQLARAHEENLEVASAVADVFGRFVTDIVRQEQTIGSAVTTLPLSNHKIEGILNSGEIDKRVIFSLAWLDRHGRVTAATDPADIGTDVSDQHFFKEITAGKHWAITNLVPSRIQGQGYILIGRGVREESGALTGVVVSKLIPEQLDLALNSGRISMGRRIMVLDTEGRTVYTYPDRLRDEDNRLQESSFVKQALAGKDVVTELPGADGRKRLIAFTPIADTGWVVGASDLECDEMARIFSDIRYEVGTFSLVALIVLGLCLVIARTIVTPLKSLREYVGSLGSGEPERRIDFKGPVELRDLASVFQLTGARIREREERLQRSRDDLEIQVIERTQCLGEAQASLRVLMKERTQAAERIRETKAQIQTVFNGISEPLMVLDKDMRIKTINDSGSRYYGIPAPEGVIGKPCFEGVMGKTAPCENCPVVPAMSGYGPTTVQRSGLFDPDTIEQVVTHPIHEGADGNSGAIVRIRDITERAKIHKQLARVNRLASLGQLSSGIAHEIRNPLSGINLFVDVLGDEEKFSRTSQERGILNEIKGNIKNINSIIKRVLDFARQSEASFTELDLAPLIEDTVELWHFKMRDGAKMLKVSVAEGLPKVLGDAIEIQQVLTNLIQNALDAVPKDGRIEIRAFSGMLSCDRSQSASIIEITDNGPGIPVEDLEKLFDPFFTTKSTGTGLGLSISHQIVTRHGGVISCDSKEGAGTTFRVELPAVTRS